jgi:hypothetical protein
MVSVSRIHTFAMDPDDLKELITHRAKAIAAVRTVYSGLIDTRLQRNADGTYTDVWQWEAWTYSWPPSQPPPAPTPLSSPPMVINEADITMGKNQPTS